MTVVVLVAGAVLVLPLAAYAWWLESQRLALEPHWDWDNQPPLGERLCERIV